MWSRRLLAGAVALVVAALGVPVHAQPATPVPCENSIGVALVDVPEKRQTDPRARAYVIDHVMPGDRFERRIRVCNGNATPVEVQVYPGAATVEGATFRATEGRVANELSSWITVDPSRVTVPARGETLVDVAFAVPSTASGGERYAAVLVEAPPVVRPGGFSVANRVGVRVYLSVGGPEEPASDFVVESVRAGRRADGAPVVMAQVRNTGDRALDMRGELALSDGPGGLSAGPFPATVGTTVGIGAVAPVEVVLDKAIDGGPWLATISMRSGLLERRSEARITFPDEVGAVGPAVRPQEIRLREDPSVVIPIAIGVFSLAVLLLLLALLRARRRRDPEPAG